VKNDVVKLKGVVFFVMAVLKLLNTASGYIYNKNRNYQHENQRLIILNDSILSENIELKNALQRKKTSAVFKTVREHFKMKEMK
jgi:hypothetical protein